MINNAETSSISGVDKSFASICGKSADFLYFFIGGVGSYINDVYSFLLFPPLWSDLLCASWYVHHCTSLYVIVRHKRVICISLVMTY